MNGRTKLEQYMGEKLDLMIKGDSQTAIKEYSALDNQCIVRVHYSNTDYADFLINMNKQSTAFAIMERGYITTTSPDGSIVIIRGLVIEIRGL